MGFSFDEQVVRIVVTLASEHPELVAARALGGELDRAIFRNQRLQRLLDRSRQSDDTYVINSEIQMSFERVALKTVQGLFYGLYRRLVGKDELKLLCLGDRRLTDAETIVDELRVSPLRDITDEPLSEITPYSWHAREPVIIVNLAPVAGGAPKQRIFRLGRETAPVWLDFGPDVFCYTFVKRDDGGGVFVMEIWNTFVIAVATPWPDDRGPLRRGRKNPLSRDKLR